MELVMLLFGLFLYVAAVVSASLESRIVDKWDKIFQVGFVIAGTVCIGYSIMIWGYA